MKKLFMAALLMIGMTSFAQEGSPMRVVDQKDQLTAEQRSQMQLKRLTTELNLDANQQQEMQRIMSDRATKREEMKKEMAANREKGVKPTTEERQNRKNAMLDYDNAEKAKLQKLLNPDQFAKYEKMKQERDDKIKANKEKRQAQPQIEKK